MLDPEGCGHVQWIHWVTQLLTVLTLEKTAAQQSDHAHKVRGAGLDACTVQE